MVTKELIEYIQSQLKQGHSQEAIKNVLLTNNWDQNDIETAFSSLNQPADFIYDNINLQAEIKKPNKHSFKTILVVIFLFLFSPLGLVLMWLWTSWSNWIKVVISLFLGIPSILVVVILYIFLSVKDISPIDDRDLLLQLVTIPKEQNAYYDLIEATQDDFFIDKEDLEKIDDIFKGNIWDEQFVENIISKKGKILAIFENAYTRPKFQDLAYEDPEKLFEPMSETSIKLNPLNIIRINQLNCLRALQLAHQVKGKEALDQALKTIEIGQKIQESQLGLIDYLLAIAIKNIGFNTFQTIINTSDLPPELIITYIQSFEKYKNNKEGLKTALKIEYLSMSQIIEAVLENASYRGKGTEIGEDFAYKSLQKIPANNFFFQPNNTKKILADYFRSGIQAVDDRCSLIKKEDINIGSLSTSTKPGIQTILSENSVGKILSKSVTSGLDIDSKLTKRCQDELLVSTTQILSALRAYKSEAGDLPPVLEGLIPKYIPTVFKDPFDGQPIRYSKEKKILYSVGKDMIDSGGSGTGDLDKMPDPSFNIKF